MPRRSISLFLAASLTCALAACSSSGGGSTGSESAGEVSGASSGGSSASNTPPSEAKYVKSPRAGTDSLVLILNAQPDTLDPVMSNTVINRWIPVNVLEPLLLAGPDGKTEPGVADKWSVSDDGLTYKFHIRDNAKFSNDKQVTAEDVVFSLNALKGSQYTAKSAPLAAVQKVEAIDPHNVQVTLERRSNQFLWGVSRVAGLVMYHGQSADSRATAPIGAGPYQVSEFKSGDHFTLTANPHYWGKKPAIKTVRVNFITDASSELNAMKSGAADVIPALDATMLSLIDQQKLTDQFNLVSSEHNTMYWINLNSLKSPTDDVAVRHAIMKAVDRSQFTKAFAASAQIIPTCTYAITTQKPWFKEASDDSCVDKYDPTLASKEIASAGNASVELTSVSDLGALPIMSQIAENQFKNASINLKWNQLTYSRYTQVVFSSSEPDYNVTVMYTTLNLPQMASCTDPAKAGWKTYCSPKAAGLLAKADSATSDESRDKYFTEAAKQLQEDAVIVPIALQKGAALTNGALKGWNEDVPATALHLANLHW